MENEAFENDLDTTLDIEQVRVDDLESGDINDSLNDVERIISNGDRGELPLLPYRDPGKILFLKCYFYLKCVKGGTKWE